MDNDNFILDEINHTSIKAQLEADLDKYVAFQKEENEMHKQYTNLLITAGYAGYFGLWAIISGREEIIKNIDKSLLNKSLVLVTFSISIFILYEVLIIAIKGYKIHFNNQVLMNAKASDSLSLRELRFRDYGKYDDYLRLMMSHLWVWSYPISVISGLTGLFILILTLIKSLGIFC